MRSFFFLSVFFSCLFVYFFRSLLPLCFSHWKRGSRRDKEKKKKKKHHLMLQLERAKYFSNCLVFIRTVICLPLLRSASRIKERNKLHTFIEKYIATCAQYNIIQIQATVKIYFYSVRIGKKKQKHCYCNHKTVTHNSSQPLKGLSHIRLFCFRFYGIPYAPFSGSSKLCPEHPRKNFSNIPGHFSYWLRQSDVS